MTHKTLLAIDTCTELCSVAVQVGEKIYSEAVDAPREHSQRLLPLVEKLVAEAGISLSDLDGIVYGRGPGSFTGIRICTSMAQGLALGQSLPVYGVSTLDSMAQQAANLGAEHILCAIDARMNEVYWAEYTTNNNGVVAIDKEKVSHPENVALVHNEAERFVACGTGIDTYPELLSNVNNAHVDVTAKFPTAESMLKLGQSAWAEGKFTPVDDLAPVYVRDEVTWKKLPGRE
ncbi:tRNA (adenosine(37)-N6)-threonylcarbamoyltransferase complex dimerization subunit type 1 TsaB [Shewanella sp. OPT22]|nr:tRNA (adenosine(37)-N6)-threonylcarbamoyltransferase complex dimerization subunit type 1 TsaB [Shewanella sp. OPT22]